MKTYHKNPRKISEKQFSDLEKWLEELDDLSGIVHDLNSDEVVGGNQRARVFDILQKKDAPIVLTDEFDPPTRQGTVALGYIQWRGERYGYRQVRWTPEQCEKANIVPNIAGGNWDWDKLQNQFKSADLLEWGFTEWELGVVPSGEDWATALGGLPDGDRAPFQQMTFTLHDSQVEQVKAALGVAKGMGAFIDSPNENSNGNALARICETFVTAANNGTS
ncbi:MAG: hypothetical protein ACYSVY_00170 [Planctomycetota bacterium]|jgi:hypothetical protein